MVTLSLPCSSDESAHLLATSQRNLQQGQNFLFPAATAVRQSFTHAREHFAPVALYRE